MLQIKEDGEELIPTFSDHELDLPGNSKDRLVRRRSSKGAHKSVDRHSFSAETVTVG